MALAKLDNIKDIIEVTLPISKSYAIRTAAAASLSGDFVTLEKVKNNNDNDDISAALDCANELHAKKIANCKESALAMRLFSFVASHYASPNEPIKLIAEGSLQTRNLEYLSKILKYFKIENKLEQLNATANSSQKIITLMSKIEAGEYFIAENYTSQILTGILMALPICKRDSIIKVSNLKSKYYVDLTLEIMSKFGVFVENFNYKEFYIKGNQRYVSANMKLESDWSAAANFFVLGAINGNVTITGLDINSKQPDKIIYDFLRELNVKITTYDNKFTIYKSAIPGFEFDATDYPDLIPPLVVLALNAVTTCYIKGIHRLTNKESDRKSAIISEFSKLGAKIRIDAAKDMFIIEPSVILGAKVFAWNDHRIAMALGIASVLDRDKIEIFGAESVNKSFPDFWEIINKYIYSNR